MNKGCYLSPNTHTHTHTTQAADSDSEARYLVLNAVANQLRYPNSHTHYFSCVLLTLFAEAKSDAVKEQITRVLLERLIVNRPHPWVSDCAVLYTWCVNKGGERERSHVFCLSTRPLSDCLCEREKKGEGTDVCSHVCCRGA